MPLHARISKERPSDQRASGRRSLRLQVTAAAAGDSAHALIHNLSEHGLLLESTAQLRIGDSLIVDLPEAGSVSAEVVWTSDSLAGCKFRRPVSTAAVSAALLRSEPQPSVAPIQSEAAAEPLAGEAPAGQQDWLAEAFENEGERALGQALLIGSLVLLLAIVAIFIVALLRFPLSMN